MENVKTGGKRWPRRGTWAGALCRPVLLLAVTAAFVLLPMSWQLIGQTPGAPDVLPFQGALVNGDGGALGKSKPANYDVVFRIYDAPSGGNLLWAEQQTVTVDDGRFSVQLGLGGPSEAEPKPSLISVFRSSTASDRYLEPTVKGVGPGGSDSTMSPRTRLLPGPYSMMSRHARTAERIVNSARTGVITIRGAQVGINTTNPVSALDVVGSTRAESLQLNGNGRVQGEATAGAWVGPGAAPVGSIILWSGTAVDKPEGWAFCDGNVVNGYRTPDLRGRFVLGASEGSGLSARRVGTTGGEENHTLVAPELPAHAHTMSLSVRSQIAGGHTHSRYSEIGSDIADYGRKSGSGFLDLPVSATGDMISSKAFSLPTTASGAHTHRLDLPETQSSPEGGGLAHPNMPPFYVLAYLVRVK